MRTVRRIIRELRVSLEPLLRVKVLVGLGFFGVLTVGMLLLAGGLNQFRQNLAINLGAELIGTVVIYAALTPILRSTEGRIREHSRLNYDWFTDRVRNTRRRIQVLDTFSGLFSHEHGQRFLDAATDLLRRGGLVEILLLSPDSPAADQRTAELRGRIDVGMETMRNLARLAEFVEQLPEDLRPRFQVRSYSAAGGITIYRWDDRLLVSFLTLGRLSGDKEQLEVAVGSSLGDFVLERFDELWADGVQLAGERRRRLAVRGAHDQPEYAARFVDDDGRLFVADARLVAACAAGDGGRAYAWLIDTPEQGYKLVAVTDASLIQRLTAVHHDKYGNTADEFVELVPHVPAQRTR
jgi:hypothetical protein